MAKRKSMAGGEIIREAQIYDVAVIGGGAAGSMAACAASEGGARTLILEANDRIGRKICATGNGRCNLTNLHVDENCYHTGGGEDLSAFFARFSVEDNIRFWESRGVYLHDRNGYVYPRTDQASTIADAFDKILRAAGTEIISGSRVTDVKPEEDSEGRVFRIGTKDKAGGGQRRKSIQDRDERRQALFCPEGDPRWRRSGRTAVWMRRKSLRDRPEPRTYCEKTAAGACASSFG